MRVISLINGEYYPSAGRLASAKQEEPAESWRRPAYGDQKRADIERRGCENRDCRLAMRLSTVLWRDEGKTENDIAHQLGEPRQGYDRCPWFERHAAHKGDSVHLCDLPKKPINQSLVE
jgi:hypothetical protein